MILTRHIGISLVKGWLLTAVVLAAVFGLIAFIEELDRVNDNYQALDAARYALAILPNQLVSLAPVIALLGSIVALSNLDRYNELTVISCTGFSRAHLLWAVLAPTFALMALLWALMEYVTPQLQQQAEQEKVLKRYSDEGHIPGGGLWSTDGQRYIHIGKLSREVVPGAISLFEFDNRMQLQRVLRASEATIGDDRRWVFPRAWEKALVDGELRTRWHRELEVANLWEKNELPTLSLNSDSMNLSVLYQYTQYLQDSSQPADRHLHSFWQRLMMPVTVVAMVLLATPISASVTAGRDRSFGLNIGIGAVLGIVFYLAAQIIFALGQLLGWNIPLVAALPALIILGIAAVLLGRMRW